MHNTWSDKVGILEVYQENLQIKKEENLQIRRIAYKLNRKTGNGV